MDKKLINELKEKYNEVFYELLEQCEKFNKGENIDLDKRLKLLIEEDALNFRIAKLKGIKIKRQFNKIKLREIKRYKGETRPYHTEKFFQ